MTTKRQLHVCLAYNDVTKHWSLFCFLN